MATSLEDTAAWSTEDGFLPVTDLVVNPVRGIHDALARTTYAFRQSLGTIAIIAVLLFLPSLLLRYSLFRFFSVELDWIWILAVVGMVEVALGSLAAPAVVYAVAKLMKTGEKATALEALGWGIKRWRATAIYMTLAGAISVLGFVLLIVPGVIAAVLLALVVPVIAVEGKLAKNPLVRSKQLAASQFFTILGAETVAVLGLFLAGAVFALPMAVFEPVASVIVGPLFAVGEQFLTVLFFFFYLASPERKPMEVSEMIAASSRP